MLAYYSTLLKKEEILKRLTDDITNLAEIANEVVCEIKVAGAGGKNRDPETIINSLEQAQKLNKVVSLMINNVKENTVLYINSLTPIKIGRAHV